MRLLRVGPRGAEKSVVRTPDGQHFDLSPVTADIDGTFWSTDGPTRVREALAAGALSPIDLSDLRIGPPIARPGVVLCVGLNYAAHAAETDAPIPEHPVVFYKAPNTIVGPYDGVPLPPGSVKTDWEVELAVVIGRRARYLSSESEALDCIAGFAVSNDLSERYLQLEVSGGQWSKGKSFESSNPLGPELVTRDEIVDPQGLGLRTHVNGDPRQDSNTSDMIFGVTRLVYLLSQFTVLDPGDLINTGTPEGVALSGRFDYLKVGDVIEVEIDGLGAQRTTII